MNALGWYAIIAVVAIGGAVVALGGCSPAMDQRAALAAKSAAYGLELDACVLGSGSYEAYEACAKVVDAKYRGKR